MTQEKPDHKPRRPPAPATGEKTAARPQSPADTRDRADEVRICGVNACRAVAETKRDRIIRVYVSEARLQTFGSLLRWCAETRRAYHVVTDAELERVTESKHHEGICLLVRRPPAPGFAAFTATLAASTGPCCLLLVENVGNPHNLGAIICVAAHFGAAGLLLAGGSGTPASLSAAAHRIAEGGLEHVPVIPVADPVRAVTALREAGFLAVATSSHVAESLYAADLPPRVLFLFGSETEGLTAAVSRAADRCVAIPGSGAVESLNVACAAAAFLSEFRRLHPLPVNGPSSNPVPETSGAAHD